MNPLDQQIAAAQRRLWANRFLAKLTVTVAMAVSAFAVIWTIQRLFDLHWPLAWIAVTLGAVTLITSTVWTLATREDALTAGARLDQAAGLRERVSTSQY